MKSGKDYIIKFSKQAEKDKMKLKSSGLDKNCKNILTLMMKDPFCYPPSYEKLSGDLNGLYSRRIKRGGQAAPLPTASIIFKEFFNKSGCYY